jgi:hypothetical protein
MNTHIAPILVGILSALLIRSIIRHRDTKGELSLMTIWFEHWRNKAGLRDNEIGVNHRALAEASQEIHYLAEMRHSAEVEARASNLKLSVRKGQDTRRANKLGTFYISKHSGEYFGCLEDGDMSLGFPDAPTPAKAKNITESLLGLKGKIKWEGE